MPKREEGSRWTVTENEAGGQYTFAAAESERRAETCKKEYQSTCDIDIAALVGHKHMLKRAMCWI
jgi:hypothetical protein